MILRHKGKSKSKTLQSLKHWERLKESLQDDPMFRYKASNVRIETLKRSIDRLLCKRVWQINASQLSREDP